MSSSFAGFFFTSSHCEKKKYKEVLFLILLTSQTLKNCMENAQDFYFQKEHSHILYFPHFSSICCSSLFLIYRWGIYKLWPTFRLEAIFYLPTLGWLQPLCGLVLPCKQQKIIFCLFSLQFLQICRKLQVIPAALLHFLHPLLEALYPKPLSVSW